MIPSITWTQPDPVNVLIDLASAVDQVDQYRELCFAVIEQIRLIPGYTRLQESNGTTASTAQNINSASDIVFAAAGSAHSWILGQFASGETILLDFINTAGDTTPQTLNIYKSTTTYAAGSTTARPVASVAGRESSLLAWNIVPWTSVVAGQYTWLRNSDGCLYFFVKQQGVSNFYGAFMILQSTTARGAYPMAIYAQATVGSDVLAYTQLNAGGNMRASQEDGVAANTCIMTSNAFSFPIWANGQDSTGNVLRFSVLVGVNTSAAARYLGALTDVAAVPALTPFNGQDALDITGTHRLRSFGDLMFPLLVGSGEI